MDETSAVAQMNFLNSIATKNPKILKQPIQNQNTILTEFFNRLLRKEKRETNDRSDHYETFAFTGATGLQEVDCKVNDLLQNKQQRLLARTKDIHKPSARIVRVPFSKSAPLAKIRYVVPNAADIPNISLDQPSPRISTMIDRVAEIKHHHLEGRSSAPSPLEVERSLFARRYGSTVEKSSHDKETPQNGLDMLIRHFQQDVDLQKFLPKLMKIDQKEKKASKRRESIKMPSIPTQLQTPISDQAEDVPAATENTIKEQKKVPKARQHSILAARRGSYIKHASYHASANEAADIDDNLDAHIPLPFTPLTNYGTNYKFKKNKKKNIRVTCQEENDPAINEKTESDNLIKKLKELNSDISPDAIRNAICHPQDLQKPHLEIPKRPEVEDADAKKGKPVRTDHLKDYGKNFKPELFKRSKITKLLHLNTIVAEKKVEKSQIVERFNIHIHKARLKPKTSSQLSIKARTVSWWTRQEYKAIDENIQKYRYEKSERQRAKSEKTSKLFKNNVHSNLEYAEIAYTSSKMKRNTANDDTSHAQNHWFESSRPSSRAYSDSQSSMFMNGQALREVAIRPRAPSNKGYFEFNIRHKRSISERSAPFYVASTKFRDSEYLA
ncbi:hypothetical protein HDV01_003897 [Terramyces sp. JEL0728]|nr:hypothetical protein HDV01_003897 [Terramyces sp. JEL0728]